MTGSKLWRCRGCNEVIAELGEIGGGKYGVRKEVNLIWEAGELFLVCPHCEFNNPLNMETTPGKGASISRPDGEEGQLP